MGREICSGKGSALLKNGLGMTFGSKITIVIKIKENVHEAIW